MLAAVRCSPFLISLLWMTSKGLLAEVTFLDSELSGFSHIKTHPFEVARNFTRCFNPYAAETIATTLECPKEMPMIRVKDVHVARTHTFIEGFCLMDSWKTEHVGDSSQYRPHHLLTHQLVTSCALQSSCRATINVTAAEHMLGQIGDGTGNYFVVVHYACLGTSTDGLQIPIHETSNSGSMIYREPTIYVTNPGYGNYTSLTRATCTLSIVHSKGTSAADEQEHGFVIQVLDDMTTSSSHGNMNADAAASDECTYHRAFYAKDHPKPTYCPVRNENITIQSEVVVLELVRLRHNAVGRFWFMIQAGKLYKVHHNDYYIQPESPASEGIKVECDVPNHTIARHMDRRISIMERRIGIMERRINTADRNVIRSKRAAGLDNTSSITLLQTTEPQAPELVLYGSVPEVERPSNNLNMTESENASTYNVSTDYDGVSLPPSEESTTGLVVEGYGARSGGGYNPPRYQDPISTKESRGMDIIYYGGAGAALLLVIIIIGVCTIQSLASKKPQPLVSGD